MTKPRHHHTPLYWFRHLSRVKRHRIIRLIFVGSMATFLAVCIDHKLAELFAASALDAVFEGLINTLD